MTLMKAPVSVGALAAILLCAIAAIDGDQGELGLVQVRKQESRKTLSSTESGEITAVDVHDAPRGAHYHLQFITMEPGSLFLPVLLHTDMLFYVLTGKGTVTWINEDGETEETEVVRGDVYRLERGTTFYMKSHPDPRRRKFRVHAIFDHIDIDNPLGYAVGPYANISDIVRGFHEEVLQMGFGVSEETIGSIKRVLASPSIVPFTSTDEKGDASRAKGITRALSGVRDLTDDAMNKKGKKKQKRRTTKKKAFNLLHTQPDVQNPYGWSTALTHDDFEALRGSNLAPFMVNLTRGSMMGPHWNPRAAEIAIAIAGRGVVEVVCPSDPSGNGPKCQNTMFKVEQGDVFVVPRFHPMTQVSYNDDVFVFVGFSSVARNNHPQFLVGKQSVLQVIDASILAASFNLPDTSKIEEMLASQGDSIMLACTSCAEDLEGIMEEEMGRREKKEEEEEERKREEEEARKREEEEEARRREVEEAREREEEARMREEEEEARRREKEEEARRREEEEEEEARRREKEKEARRREEEEEARRREKEKEARQREEEEEARRREKEEEARRREEQQEEAAGREEAAAKRREEEEARGRKEEAEEREEEAKRREEEEEEARRIAEEEEEEARRRGEEE